jgi:glycosyltransferase involved in cell wall biosynthesis
LDKTPLHIGIDGRELLGRPTGVGRFLKELRRAWSKAPGIPHRFTVFDNRDGTSGTWWEQTQLPRLAARARIDVLFSPGYTAPLRLPCPSVLAVHDVSFFAHPEWFQWREGLRRRWLTKAAARRAHTVVTISEFSAGEIQRWLGVPRDRIEVVYLGAPTPAAHASASAAPVVLFVGSLFNRRHIAELIRGFAHVLPRVPDARLVLVGDNRTSPRLDPLAIAAEAGVKDRVTWHAYAAGEELDRLYASARVFAFLSEYEGFALTPLEALAHGVPPVLLDTPVAREIYREGARYVTTDTHQIASALGDLLVDEPSRVRVLSEGRGLLEHYNWDRAAARVLTTLEEAAAKS